MSRPNRTATADELVVVQALEAGDLHFEAALGKYRLLGTLGHGGMADVYLAVADGPEGFRKLCVLKTLRDSMAQDEDFRAMFLDEARLAARLNHPNVVQTFEVDDSEGRLLLAMEYVEGQPVTRVRRRLSPEDFPLTAHIRVLCDVLDALDYAHHLTDFDGSVLGIVHRDVTPHNILVGYDGRVKLVDFGIAKSSAAVQMTQAGVLKGKVGYMAPEQASLQEIDGRADVFSVGVILWEAIAGKRLAEGLSARDALLRRVEGKDPKIAEVVPEVDPELAAICDRAMAHKPAARYAGASELQADLEQWLRKHGELPRKKWAKSLKDAFAPERQQLRSVVEQRLTDPRFSGIRNALLASTGAGRAADSGGTPALTSSGDGPTVAALRSSGSISGVHPSLVGAGAPAVPEASRSYPVAEGAQKPKPPYLGFALGGLAVVSVIAGVAFFAMSSRAQKPDVPPPVPSSTVVASPSTPASASAAPTEPTQVAAPTSASPSATHAPGKPGFHYPIPNVKPVVGAATGATPPTTPATTTPTATPPKPTARPLDDKDPYAP
ncbi:MAG: serine/threonine protein kinase [Myxococcales bacterium]|nr:serine/threonine protein kinase [Myxococcales bacterium]